MNYSVDSHSMDDRVTTLLPKCSIVIVNTNELHHLKICLPTIISQNYPDFEVIVVDNASQDGSIDYIERAYPQVKVVRNQCNLGYAAANNIGFESASGDYIAVLNPDTKVEPDWLIELVSALEDDRQAAMATPKILLLSNPERINTCGNEITLTGLTFCRGLDQPRRNYPVPETVSAVSGAAFVIRKSVLTHIGGFDESFFIYYEDTDLSLRAILAGYECLYIPTSVIFHNYSFKFSPRKCYFQERNRYYSLLKTLRWPTFFVLLPELLISEVLAWGYAIICSSAHVNNKFQSYVWLVRNINKILTARKKVQNLRSIPDKRLLRQLGCQLSFSQTTNSTLSSILGYTFNPLLFLLGQLSLLATFW